MTSFKPFVDGALEFGQPGTDAPPAFATSLKLTPERRAWLEARIHLRIGEVCKEMGLDDEGLMTVDGWMEVRQNNIDSYANDFSWRERKGGVFTDSNFTLGTNGRYTDALKAKACDDILGTTPYLSVMDIDHDEDEDLVAAIDRKVQTAIENSNVTPNLREAIFLAIIKNECVTKTTYLRTATNFIGPAEVMVDESGNPIRTQAKQLYIMRNDDFVADPDTQGLFRLKKDPSYSIIDPKISNIQPQFRKYTELQQELVTYDGPDVRPLDHRDFWCPLRYNSIHEADINVHVYTEDPEVLQSFFGAFDVSGQYFDEYETGATQAIDSQSEKQETDSSRVVERIKVGEVYIRADADEDGSAEEIFCVMDLKRNRLIYWDYLANSMKKRPFEVIVGGQKVPGRWYGIGVYSKMEHTETYIDAQFNRYNNKDSTTASVTFKHAGAVKEWDTVQPVIGGTDVYTINNPTFGKDKPPMFRINLSEQSETGERLIHMMQQAGDLRYGQISAQDASASGLNSSKTATGNMIIERSSNALSREAENEIAGDKNTGGVEAVLAQVVEITLEHMDPSELMFTKDGQKLITLNRDEIREMPRNVKLLLTRMRSAESLQSSQHALAVAKDFLAMRKQDPASAKILRPEYVRQLKALQCDDADDLCPEISDEDIAAFKQAQMQQQQAEQRPESLSINYKDAPDPIKRQMEAKAGLQPLTPEQEAQEAGKAQATAEHAAALKQPAQKQPTA